jgi:uncharacterized protein with HEPN domain
MLPESDRIRIQHMLEAAEQALSFVEGRERPHLDTDLDVVWKTVTQSVPALVCTLRGMPGPQDPR